MNIAYEVQVTTNSGDSVIFKNISLDGQNYHEGNMSLKLRNEDGRIKVTVTPENNIETITQITHRVTTKLRNFHSVIIPDSGRNYFSNSQLVDFWYINKNSTVNNICVPLFIFTGQNHQTGFTFGIIGKDYETSFRNLEPSKNRALQAYYKRLTLEISRGYQGCPIPVEYSQVEEDHSITEYLFLRDYAEQPGEPWIMTLRDFCRQYKDVYNIQFPFSAEGMEPLWCSWTDWHSDNVTEEEILDNVRKGVPLGIINYIIDDGWFGPGLDSDFSVPLNIGDWEADLSKISDIRVLSQKIKELGGRPMIWCAPHAVGQKANCFEERKHLLIKDEKEALVLTYNKFHILCLRSPEAREVMADICVKLARDYETDGAKYDLFNCIPDIFCCSHDHKHDTESMVIGLDRLMKRIWEKVREVHPGYIVELKQNYGGPFLAQYGTMMRAGDTPYNPEGNFIRTAFIQAYTPYAINDYQTITNFDTPQESAVIIIKMLAVGIPTYSMDITILSKEQLSVLKHYNNWYLQVLKCTRNYSRIPLDADLNIWKLETPQDDNYFIINSGNRIYIQEYKDFNILNGSTSDEVIVGTDKEYTYILQYYDYLGVLFKEEEVKMNQISLLIIPVGGMVHAVKAK